MEHCNDQCLLKLAVLINWTKLTDTKGRDISSHFFFWKIIFFLQLVFIFRLDLVNHNTYSCIKSLKTSKFLLVVGKWLCEEGTNHSAFVQQALTSWTASTGQTGTATGREDGWHIFWLRYCLFVLQGINVPVQAPYNTSCMTAFSVIGDGLLTASWIKCNCQRTACTEACLTAKHFYVQSKYISEG